MSPQEITEKMADFSFDKKGSVELLELGEYLDELAGIQKTMGMDGLFHKIIGHLYDTCIPFMEKWIIRYLIVLFSFTYQGLCCVQCILLIIIRELHIILVIC